ncbi:MAG: hypothetical protein OEY93_12820, partial [Anaerolineae bacterium]|nr:hypothetical protein [Anaerolineae bacterium]
DMSWLSDFGSPAEPESGENAAAFEQPQEALEPAAAQDDEMAWLQDLAPDRPVGEEDASAQPASFSDDSPEWIDAQDAETQPIPVWKDAHAEEAAAEEDMSWLADFGSSGEPVSQEFAPEPAYEQPAAGGQSLDDEDDSMAWLEGLAAKQGVPEEELITAPETRPEGQIPGFESWESEENFTAEETAAGAGQPSPQNDMSWLGDLQEEPEAVPEQGSPAEDEDDSMAWLEGLAAKQGVPEEELTTHPDARPTTTPEWIEAEPEYTGEDSFAPSAQDMPFDLSASMESDLHPPASDPTQEENGAPLDWLDDLEVPDTDEPVLTASQEWMPEKEILEDFAEDAPSFGGQQTVQPTELPMMAEKPMPKIAPKKKTPAKVNDPELLGSAKQALHSGETEKAAGHFSSLIKRGKNIQEIIDELNEALRRYPIDAHLWQAMGDALTRQDMLQEALDAYSKAEDLLRE